ncbi:expressed protein [Phakopsora pachyrhizi]|uniref:Expressed protein n=1 Tax=Phakopsora pachyrhizi TaxID=170000 RepID=A0AAV0B0T0_PHAPC|nr:expressed protein [Phakopsora pachyrhizi]
MKMNMLHHPLLLFTFFCIKLLICLPMNGKTPAVVADAVSAIQETGKVASTSTEVPSANLGAEVKELSAIDASVFTNVPAINPKDSAQVENLGQSTLQEKESPVILKGDVNHEKKNLIKTESKSADSEIKKEVDEKPLKEKSQGEDEQKTRLSRIKNWFIRQYLMLKNNVYPKIKEKSQQFWAWTKKKFSRGNNKVATNEIELKPCCRGKKTHFS